MMKILTQANGGIDEKMCHDWRKMDESMDEVVRRLEEGTYPNELEDRMSDFDFENHEQHQPDADEPKDKTKAIPKKFTFRDPYLYEFEDYLQ